MSVVLYYNGTDFLNSIGIECVDIRRSIFPEKINNEITIPSLSGSYDFANNVYGKRFIEVDVQQAVTNRTLWDSMARALDTNAYSNLTFSDEPTKYYMARIYNPIALKEILTLGRTTIVFECQPYAYYQTNYTTPWSSIATNTTALTTGTTVSYTNTGGSPINLKSGRTGKFKISVEGTWDGWLQVSDGTKAIKYNVASGGQPVTLIIDNINCTVTLNGSNVMASCTGDLTDFLTLSQPSGTFTVTANTTKDITVKIDYTPQYI